MEKEALLEVRHLKKYFDVEEGLVAFGSAKVKAVDDVSFKVQAGETFGLVGESGCGKSTLGRTIVRLMDPTEGQIFLEGVDMASLRGRDMKNARRKIQIIFQDPSASLNPRKTIHDTLMEPYIVHNLYSPEEREGRIKNLIEKVGIADYFLSRYPHELSGGQKQRIGVARALALNPKLIICDEPVSALDVSVQAQVINLLVDLQEEFDLTYIFISHNLNVVYQVSDRVGVMYLGKMVEIARYNQLYSSPMHPYTEALLSAFPQVDKETRTTRIILQGDVPSPVNPPPGCRFHTRCSKVFERCRVEEPIIKTVGDGHSVACHLYD